MSIRNSTGEGEAWLRVHVRRSYDGEGLASVEIASPGGCWHAVAETSDMRMADGSPWVVPQKPEPIPATPSFT